MGANRQVVLHAYRFSVYARVVRMTLIEKGVPWREVEVDPFGELSPGYLALNPFGRVPTLADGDFVLYETAAITRYIDEAFDGPPLQPADPRERARMAQAVAIVDSYGYWPLVRQVFSHRVFRPAEGAVSDEGAVMEGLARAPTVLAALDGLCADRFLAGEEMCLADLHLAPMIAYFTQATEGAEMLGRYPRLQAWWTHMRERPALKATEPGLPVRE